MDAEEYIAIHGATLTESEKRYIRVFGPPSGFTEGASRTPYTPGLQIADAPEDEDAVTRMHREAQEEEEAAEWGEL